MNGNEPEKVEARPEQLGLTAKDSRERYGARAWDETEAANELYRAFYDEHKPVEWKPVVSSRGISQLSLPVLIPCESDKADGHIYYQAYPQRIAELPVRQLNPRELLKTASPLWQEHLDGTLALTSALEADKGVSKIIREQLGAEDFAQQAQQNPWSYAASLLNSGLFDPATQLVAWWRKREKYLDLGVYCPNRRAAAYALLLSRGTRPIQIGICQWERCRKKFQRDDWHPNVYCSAKCRNAAAQAAFRERKAARRKRRGSARR